MFVSSLPITVAGLTDAARITVGTKHTCAVRFDLSVRCWGANSFGQIGTGAKGSSRTPVAIPSLTGASQLSLSRISCGSVGGVSKCWGLFVPGVPGQTEAISASSPQGIAMPAAIRVAAGQLTACAITPATTVVCIGRNDFGALGTGQSGDAPTAAVAVPGLIGVTDLVMRWHGCAVRTGEVWCWGYNASGQAGPSTSSVPVRIPGISNAVEIRVNEQTTCARLADGSVTCWGDNSYNLLGTGFVGAASSMPVTVAGVANATRLEVGENAACVVRTGGSVQCWGALFGPVGATTTPGTVVTVPLPTAATDLAVGTQHACAVGTGGSVSCWYAPFNAPRVAPQTIGGLPPVASIAAHGDRVCVITATTAEVLCWGSNDSGGLGDGTGFYLSPQTVVAP
jgi:alpha-tubulin suppressor-like RCC1 family protein